MNKHFLRLDNKYDGWPSTLLVIFAEIFLVYLVSNLPFILTTLETPKSSSGTESFFATYQGVLSDEIQSGQLLTFICALIAPVVFWSFAEFRKAVMTKLLSTSSLLLLVVAAYLHSKEGKLEYLSSYGLYQIALCVWIASIVSNRLPPDRKAFFREHESQEENFIEMTKARD